jgi:hypothetical protein
MPTRLFQTGGDGAPPYEIHGISTAPLEPPVFCNSNSESDSLHLICLAEFIGKNYSQIAKTTRPCAGRRPTPHEQWRLSARWMQCRKNGPDCLSAASFRAVRPVPSVPPAGSASYGHLTRLRVASTACPHKAGFNKPCFVRIAGWIPTGCLFTPDTIRCPAGRTDATTTWN